MNTGVHGHCPREKEMNEWYINKVVNRCHCITHLYWVHTFKGTLELFNAAFLGKFSFSCQPLAASG